MDNKNESSKIPELTLDPTPNASASGAAEALFDASNTDNNAVAEDKKVVEPVKLDITTLSPEEQAAVNREILHSRGLDTLMTNTAQAMYPDSGEVIVNRVGTAPILVFRLKCICNVVNVTCIKSRVVCISISSYDTLNWHFFI